MKHLYFVRHGLSEMNKQGVFSGASHTSLATEGIEQSHAAGRELVGKGIDVIVASPVARAHDTALIIADELGIPADHVLTHDSLVERNFGPLEGAPYKPNMPLDDTDGVEHSTSVVERVNEALDFIKSLDADTVLVVSHGAIGRALQTILEPDTAFHATQKFENAKVVKLL